MLETNSRSPSPEPKPRTHVQEQEALRNETISVFHHAVEPADEDDDLLIPREKAKDELEEEEEEYQEYLKREVGEDISGLITIEENSTIVDKREEEEEVVSEKKKKKKKSKKGKQEESQETDQGFLMNYILNRGWIDRSTKRIPTYKEVTHDTGVNEEDEQQGAPADAPLEDDEEFEEIAETFETSYNFRYEEPNAAVIQTHPRNLDSTVRRKDTTRKEARERRKQRKEEELQRKKEEVRRMKALKAKELRHKLEEIEKEGGLSLDPGALAEFDLDGEWDPEKHDRQMAGLWEEDAEEDPEHIEKPSWNDDIDVGDIISDVEGESSKPSKKKKKKKQRETEDMDDGVDMDAMDADNPRGVDEEEWDGTEEMRKRKVQEYLDEIYGMDFNDMVGDMPTRFKYTQVAPQSYSLTPAEILLATDKELNEYMSIKKIAPYRKDGRWDIKRADRLKELKAKIKDRMGADETWTGESGEKKPKKRKGKKERQRGKNQEGEAGAEEAPVYDSDRPSKKRRKE